MTPHDPVRAPALLADLRSTLKRLDSVLVCFSGGIDSTLVLAVAHAELGARAVGMTAVSPSLSQADRQESARIAAELGAEHRLVDSEEFSRPGYVANGPDRCFHCKTELYEIAAAKQREWNLAAVVNGTNADDVRDYRPGLAAAKNAEVKSPLLDLGFTKRDVREVAKLLGVSSYDKPAAACLSSRIPFGTEVTHERLRQVEEFEAKLRDLGFRQLRVRWHESIARIEVDLTELPRFLDPTLRPAVVAAGKACGFQYVTADLGGYRTGSHNEMLDARRLRVL